MFNLYQRAIDTFNSNLKNKLLQAELKLADVGKVLGIVNKDGKAEVGPVEGGSGSGLPDPSELQNGTAMIAIDGEWKMQEGYAHIVQEYVYNIENNSYETEETSGGFNQISFGDILPHISDRTGASPDSFHYDVIFDGVAYDVTSHVTGSRYGLIFGGNLVNSNNISSGIEWGDYPFCIITNKGSDTSINGCGVLCKEPGEHTVCMKFLNTIYNKFDSVYIPTIIKYLGGEVSFGGDTFNFHGYTNREAYGFANATMYDTNTICKICDHLNGILFTCQGVKTNYQTMIEKIFYTSYDSVNNKMHIITFIRNLNGPSDQESSYSVEYSTKDLNSAESSN